MRVRIDIQDDALDQLLKVCVNEQRPIHMQADVLLHRAIAEAAAALAKRRSTKTAA